MHEIRYSPDFNKDYIKLKQKVDLGSNESLYILNLINKATIILSKDINAGKKIPKNLWPKEYIQKYDIKNLWKYNLDSNWRLVYTITGDSIDLFLIYLEYMKHKDYERKFNYRKS
ncbi:MAG: hypothetical protein V1824_04680 [archaeon]